MVSNISYATSDMHTTSDTSELSAETLKASFQEAKKQEGILGSIIDFGANLLGTKNSSKNIEAAIEALNDESTQEDLQTIQDMIETHEEHNDRLVNMSATFAAGAAGAAAGAQAGGVAGAAIGSVVPVAGTAIGGAVGALGGALVGAVAGAAAKVGILQIENMTDKVKGNSWQNDEHLKEEAISGAKAGAISGGLAGVATGAKAVKTASETVKGTSQAWDGVLRDYDKREIVDKIVTDYKGDVHIFDYDTGLYDNGARAFSLDGIPIFD